MGPISSSFDAGQAKTTLSMPLHTIAPLHIAHGSVLPNPNISTSAEEMEEGERERWPGGPRVEDEPGE